MLAGYVKVLSLNLKTARDLRFYVYGFRGPALRRLATDGR